MNTPTTFIEWISDQDISTDEFVNKHEGWLACEKAKHNYIMNLKKELNESDELLKDIKRMFDANLFEGRDITSLAYEFNRKIADRITTKLGAK